MARVSITFEDEGEGCTVQTDGLISAGGTAAEQVAYQVLRLLADLEGIPWEELATPVTGDGEGN